MTAKKKAHPSLRKPMCANAVKRRRYILTPFQEELLFGIAILAMLLVLPRILGYLCAFVGVGL